MIHSSGQIISAQAASDIMNGIGAAKDADGYTRITFKAVCVAQSPTGEDAGGYGDRRHSIYSFRRTKSCLFGNQDGVVFLIEN